MSFHAKLVDLHHLLSLLGSDLEFTHRPRVLQQADGIVWRVLSLYQRRNLHVLRQ